MQEGGSGAFKEYKLNMVEELRSLFEGRSCRRRGLLKHFQDVSGLGTREDCCDRCAE